MRKQGGEWKPYNKNPFTQAVDNKKGLDRMMGEADYAQILSGQW